MQYHIQTDPIWEAFKSGCDCPLCEIYSKNEERLVGQYLEEAVMIPEFRVNVNKFGFCRDHIKKLFAGKNKLGLALQLSTRTQTVRESVTPCTNHKQAVKQAERLNKTMDSCVICNELNIMMKRYAQTIAQMFAHEKDFFTPFTSCKGFCMPHYALLLKESNSAGSQIKRYLNELVYLQNRSLAASENRLQQFTDRFDYRNAGSSVKPDGETIPSAIKKLKGRIL